jgi:hypothetical protein
MKSICSAALAATLLFVSACGDNQGQRALSGGAIGAGAGAVGGALIGGSVLGGAVVGGLGGAAIGALTDRHQIDLDR